jgi:hypothetical protein
VDWKAHAMSYHRWKNAGNLSQPELHAKAISAGNARESIIIEEKIFSF